MDYFQNAYVSKSLPYSMQYSIHNAIKNTAPIERMDVRDYPPNLSKYFEVKHLEDYYTPAYISIFFNGISVSDCAVLEYIFKDNKLPVYGYGDRFFSSIEEGHYLVSGRFGLLFKEVAFLPVLLDIINGNRAWLKVPNLVGSAVMKVDNWLQNYLKGYTDEEGNYHGSVQFSTLYNTVLQRLSRIMGVKDNTLNKWMKSAYESGDRIHAAVRLLQIYKVLMRISLDEKFSNYSEYLFSPYMDIYDDSKYDAFMSSGGSLATPASPIFWKRGSITHQVAPRIELEEIFTESSIEGLFEAIEDAIWGYGYEDYRGLPPVMEHDSSGDSASNRPILDTFDIVIRYGEEGNPGTDHTIQVINNVHITSVSQSINISSPDIVLDIYEFFAENMNQKIVSEGENNYIDIEMVKNNIGYRDDINTSFFDLSDNYFTESNNLRVVFSKPWKVDFTLENNIFSVSSELGVPRDIFKSNDEEGEPLFYISMDTGAYEWGPFYFPHEFHIRSASDTMDVFYSRIERVIKESYVVSGNVIQGVFDKLIDYGFFDTSIKGTAAYDEMLQIFKDRFIESRMKDLDKNYYCSVSHVFDYSGSEEDETLALSNVLQVSKKSFNRFNSDNYMKGLLRITVPCEDYQYRQLCSMGIIIKRDYFWGHPS